MKGEKHVPTGGRSVLGRTAVTNWKMFLFLNVIVRSNVLANVSRETPAISWRIYSPTTIQDPRPDVSKVVYE